MYELKKLTEYSDEALLAEMRRVASEFSGKRLTREVFDLTSRVHSTTLANRFGSWADALERAGISSEIAPRPRRITRDDLLDAIRSYASEYGEAPRLEDIANRLGVHRTTIQAKFGKWATLLKDVGLQSVPLGRRYTDEECYENIVRLWTHYGRQPNFKELNQAPSLVGSKAYTRRWGGWRRALAAFIDYVNQTPQPPDDGAQKRLEDVRQLDSSPDKNVASEPRSLGLAQRYRILCRDRFCCKICGRSPAKDIGVELHVDHIVPWSKGGQNVDQNLRTLCFDCNLGKGAKLETLG